MPLFILRTYVHKYINRYLMVSPVFKSMLLIYYICISLMT